MLGYAVPVPLRFVILSVILLALPACIEEAPRPVEDAGRFEKRDGALPSPDAFAWGDAADAAVDAVPLVDIARRDTSGYDLGASTDTSAVDASAPPGDVLTPCEMLAEEYAAAVCGAQTCTGAAACAASVCETPCCVCRVYANPMTEPYRRLMGVQDRWTAYRCAQSITCPTMQCNPPRTSDCSSEGRCVTLRGT